MERRILTGDCLNVMADTDPDSFDSIVTDPPYGLGFMGKKWDHGVPGSEYWAHALGVAKPGAHLLAFGGTRTFHRLACAIEDAGWEIRDCLMWVYGSGFPKSHNLKGEWDGWGTALKPAWEPIIMARKPFKGTVAKNVLRHGTGAVNIDACRVEFTDDTDRQLAKPGGKTTSYSGCLGGKNGAKFVIAGEGGLFWSNEHGWADRDSADEFSDDSINDPIGATERQYLNARTEFASVQPSGRWPANLIHDGSDEVVAMFPDAAGQLAPSVEDGEPQGNSVYGSMNRGGPHHTPRQETCKSAARFFYCPKASKSDRGADNKHPTVKPTELMRYLCRLVTPLNGIILDPFAGSGSTGKAATLEGFGFVGIEIDESYAGMAATRIA